MAQQFDSVAGVLAAAGRDLGATEWMPLTQERINLFADATGDHQWIHVDEARAAAGPFGGCIAHGYLTLSLASKFLPELVEYDRLKMGVNYGCDKVRFAHPGARPGRRRRGSEGRGRAGHDPRHRRDRRQREARLRRRHDQPTVLRMRTCR